MTGAPGERGSGGPQGEGAMESAGVASRAPARQGSVGPGPCGRARVWRWSVGPADGERGGRRDPLACDGREGESTPWRRRARSSRTLPVLMAGMSRWWCRLAATRGKRWRALRQPEPHGKTHANSWRWPLDCTLSASSRCAFDRTSVGRRVLWSSWVFRRSNIPDRRAHFCRASGAASAHWSAARR
jgi:hypothetical protein